MVLLYDTMKSIYNESIRLSYSYGQIGKKQIQKMFVDFFILY